MSSRTSRSPFAPGEILGLVGESGSGKTVTSLSIMRLIPSPPGRIVGRRGPLRRARTCSLPTSRRCGRLRGGEIAMIFQDPMSSLNPAFTVGDQIDRGRAPARGRRAAGGRGARALEMLDLVGIPDAAAPRRPVPAPVLGRHAPAGDDRHGVGLPTRAAHRRRADDRARRDRPGPDPRAAAGAAARDWAWR